MYKHDFIIKQGESFIQDVYFKSKTTKEIIPFKDGTTAKAQIRKHPGDEELEAEITCTVSPERGKIKLTLSDTITINMEAGIYYYDLAITEENDIIYYLEGKFIIKKPVTEVNDE